MMKSLLRVLSAGMLVTVAGLSGLALAEDAVETRVSLKNGHPQVYYVKQGDTLWDISTQFLQSPWQWPELWHVNEEIDNPHLIYPGDVIKLVFVDGQPQLQLQRNGDRAVAGQQETQPTVKLKTDGSVVRLSPEIRSVPLEQAVPAIPLSSVQHFLREALVVTRQDVADAPYIVSGSDNRVVFGAGDDIYAVDPVIKWEDMASSYGVYRVGHVYIDPQTKETLGIEALQIGTATTSDLSAGVGTLRVVNATEDLRIKDRLLKGRKENIRSTFFPSAPDVLIDARAIRFFDRLHGIARNDVLVINKGRRDGLREGHVLEALTSGSVVKDPLTEGTIKLPDVTSGTVVLFRVFEKVSYGLVVEATRPIKIGDRLTNPAGSLPQNM